MTSIPRAALLLGLIGLLPFLWGALTSLTPIISPMDGEFFAKYSGPDVLIGAGRIVLTFMSGILWGFASRAKGFSESLGYFLGALPAAYVFVFIISDDPRFNLGLLMFGFICLLALDRYFMMKSLAPDWWMKLRLPLTAVVCICLASGLAA